MRARVSGVGAPRTSRDDCDGREAAGEDCAGGGGLGRGSGGALHITLAVAGSRSTCSAAGMSVKWSLSLMSASLDST